MQIKPFKTEQFFAEYEFITPHILCASDCETLSVGELLEMAGISLSDMGHLSLGYTESQGNPALRKAITSLYKTVNVDEVVELGTPVEGIYLAARALLEPGDEVIVLTPAYDALINLFEHVVGPEQVKMWAFQPTATGWQLDFDQLQSLITPHTKLVVVNFPHNPTGFLPSPAQQRELVQIVERYNLHLFYDEMYFGLFPEGTTPIPSAVDISPRAIVLSGLSKTYGLPGLRTGWLIIRDKAVRDNIINWKYYTSICPPAPSEFLALAALRVHDQLRMRSLSYIEHNTKLAADFFARWPDLFVSLPPLAGSIALVQMNVPSVSALAEKLAKEAGVLIQSAAMLNSDDQHMRIGLGRAGFSEGLAKFEAYLTERGFQ